MSEADDRLQRFAAAIVAYPFATAGEGTLVCHHCRAFGDPYAPVVDFPHKSSCIVLEARQVTLQSPTTPIKEQEK